MSTRRVVRLGILVVVVLAPWLALSAVWVPGAAALISLVLLGTVPATVVAGWRLAAVVAVALAVTGPLAAALNDQPVAGATLVAAAGATAAWSATRGWRAGVLMVPVVLALLIVDPPALDSTDGAPTVDGGYLLVLGLLIGAMGAWTVLVAGVALRGRPRTTPEGVTARVAVAYGVVLVVALAIGTWVVLRWVPGGRGAWWMLSIVVVLQPSTADTVVRAGQRVGGTLLGATTAAIVLALGAGTGATAVLGLVALVGALALLLTRQPYWRYATALTTAVVLLDSPMDGGLGVDLQRLGYTLLGAATVAVVGLVVLPVRRLVTDRGDPA